MPPKFRKQSKKKGAALVTTFAVMTLVALAGVTYLDWSTQTVRESMHNGRDISTTHLCEAGIQVVTRELWRPFRSSQKFNTMQSACNGAGPGAEKVVRSGEVPTVGRYIAAVIGYNQVNNYLAVVKIKSVGYLDRNNNGQLDPAEPFKEVNTVARFELSRSQIFDYTYFINNYGWMDGFGVNDLVVNGDMRANGNFDFLNGSPTVNGTVIAAANDKLDPKVPGFINTPPVKWTDATYLANSNSPAYGDRQRWRQVYNSTKHGVPGSAEFNTWRDTVFESNGAWVDGSVVNGAYVPPSSFGAVQADSRGVYAWDRTSVGSAGSKTLLDTRPTKEVVMPDLNDINQYKTLSNNFASDPGQYQKANYGDGSANPNFGQPPYVEVWNTTTNKYDRITDSGGVINGSAVLVGTNAHPIKLYGPVTVTQDIVIKGNVKGQGTLYAGRNVHVVGSVRYDQPPSWAGVDPHGADVANEKKDIVAFAARGSIIMGDPTTFANPYPLYYMMPPFTHGRYDDNGTYIPAFNAMDTDSTGRRKYQSVVPDSTIHSLAEGINQIDGIMYTNYVGGGNVGTGGGGVVFNGTIISKDESIVTWSLPIKMNYDNRIRERGPDTPPLIDLQLPRQPTLMRSTWQDKGFYENGTGGAH
ncbi:MAG: hypothetical protein JSS66_13360 [Armatimonadetes bacterium]|nr:hypothetical protein [Armatimonadota bacterium]